MYTQPYLFAGFLLATTALSQSRSANSADARESTDNDFIDPADPLATDSALVAAYSKFMDDSDSLLAKHTTDPAGSALGDFVVTQTAVPRQSLAAQLNEAYGNAQAGHALPTDAPLFQALPSSLGPYAASVLNEVAAVASSDIGDKPALSSYLAAAASDVSAYYQSSDLGDFSLPLATGQLSTLTRTRTPTSTQIVTLPAGTTVASSASKIPSNSMNGTVKSTGSMSVSTGSLSPSPTTQAPPTPHPSSGAVKLSFAFGGLVSVGLAAVVLL